MKDEEIVMSLENDLKKTMVNSEADKSDLENSEEIKPEEKEVSPKEEKVKEKVSLKDFFKMIAEKISSIGKSVSNFIAYVTTPKEIKKMVYEEAAKEAKLEAKKETIEVRKYKMDIVRDVKKKDSEKIRELSKLAHTSNRTVSIALNSGGIVQFEPVAKGVSIKYAEPHLKPGTQDVVHDFAPIGGVLFRSYNSEKIELEDFSSILKAIEYERGFSQDLIKESSITNISDERITEEEISISEPMPEVQTAEMNRQILENDFSGVNQMIDHFYPPTTSEQPFFSEKKYEEMQNIPYEQIREMESGMPFSTVEFSGTPVENNYSDQEISLEGNSANTEFRGFLDSDYEYNDDEER